MDYRGGYEVRLANRPKTLAAIGVVAALGITALPFANHAQAQRQGAVTGKVGFLISDFTTSARWKTDLADVIAALKITDPGVTVVEDDAHTNQTTQNNQAKSLLTEGVKAIIDVPVDSLGAKQIVQDAHANKPPVPVLAYDRLIQGAPVDAYATFNGFAVGVKQATFLKFHVKKGSTIVSIAGSSDDNNAHLFHDGAFSVLRPLFKKGYFKLGYDKYTPAWSSTTAQAEMASALTKLNNKVGGVLVANDGMDAGVIAALRAQHLAGKVPITGQDGTVAGLQQILLGNQGMTVYKPIKNLAVSAAHIVHLLLNGQKFTSPHSFNNGVGNVPTSLLPVVTVTAKNMRETVIKDGFATRAEICANIPASACAKIR